MSPSMISNILCLSPGSSSISPLSVKASSTRGSALRKRSIENPGRTTSSVISRCLMIRFCAASISLTVGSSRSGNSSSVWQPVQSSIWDIWRSNSVSLSSVRRLAFRCLRLISHSFRSFSAGSPFRIFEASPMTKSTDEIGIELMISARRRAGLAVEMFLLVCIVSAGISAAGIVLARQVL